MRRPAGLPLALVLLAGCGGTEPKAAAAPQSGELTATVGDDGLQAISIDADKDFRFVPYRFQVSPGPVRLTVRNTSGVVHSLKFDAGGPTEEIPLVRAGESETIEFTVTTPGEYSFVCTFHLALNQRGVMIVT